MLTVETLSIAVDQTLGHLHDPSQSLGAVPFMIVLTLIGLTMSCLFLSRVEPVRGPTPAVRQRRRTNADQRPVPSCLTSGPRRPTWH
jgi:hypothetical protein